MQTGEKEQKRHIFFRLTDVGWELVVSSPLTIVSSLLTQVADCVKP